MAIDYFVKESKKQECNCCTHEEICAKSIQYKKACEKIQNAIDSFDEDLLVVNVKCRHFIPKTTQRRGV